MTIYVDAGTSYNGSVRQQSKICIASDTAVLLQENIGSYTINEAEIIAIGKAIEMVKKKGEPAVIHSDSKLAVNMVTGKWKGKMPHLRELAGIVKEGLADAPPIEISWVPRFKNKAGIYLETGKLGTPRSGKYDKLFYF